MDPAVEELRQLILERMGSRTQQEYARFLGVSPAALSKVLRGRKKNPTEGRVFSQLFAKEPNIVPALRSVLRIFNQMNKAN